jgi:hypothetical protein
LARGADVEKANDDSFNAIDCVLLTVPFQPKVAALLLEHAKSGINYIDDGFNYLLSCESLEALKFCVENGIDINYLILGRETILCRLDRVIQMNAKNNYHNKMVNSKYQPNVATYMSQRDYLISIGAERISLQSN